MLSVWCEATRPAATGMTPEEMEALKEMPVVLERGLLPPGSPPAVCIAALERAGLIILIENGDLRWAQTAEGQEKVREWKNRRSVG